MKHPKWSLVIALTVFVALGAWCGVGEAQYTDTPSTGQLQPTGTGDLQTSTWSGTDWASLWTGRFSSPWVYSWGRPSLHSKSGRASIAVLRERRGLLR